MGFRSGAEKDYLGELIDQTDALMKRYHGSDESGRRQLLPSIDQLLRRIGQHIVRQSQLGGRVQEIPTCWELELLIFRTLGDRLREGVALHNVGTAYLVSGMVEEALQRFLEAVDIAREVNNTNGEAIALSNIGVAYQKLGRYKDALKYLQQSLQMYKAMDDAEHIIITTLHLGDLFRESGQLPKAHKQYQQALKLARKKGMRLHESMTLSYIGYTHRITGRLQESLDQYQQSLAIDRELGNRIGQSIVLYNMGLACQQMGNLEEALDFLEKSIQVDPRVGSRWLAKGEVLEALGRTEEAVASYRRACELEPKDNQAREALERLQGTSETPTIHPQQVTEDVRETSERTIDEKIHAYLEQLDQQGISSPLEIYIDVKIQKGMEAESKSKAQRLWGVRSVATSGKVPSLLVTAQVYSVKVITGLLTALREVEGVDQTVQFPLDIGEMQGSTRRSWLSK
jgi:tetratricopeptide (TPR) repeat protein